MLALKQCVTLNDWGMLEPERDNTQFDGIATKALTAIGPKAIPSLIPLLDDRRSAPITGSEESTVAIFDNYRRSDYAYKCLMMILKTEPAICG